MGRKDNNRATRDILRYLPSGVTRRVRWEQHRGILWVDIALTSKEELEWVHKQMFKRAPCFAMVRIHQLIWTYYTGAAVGEDYHLTTIGQTCYDLMRDALELRR